MSRIHDALKKAEQGRIAAAASESAVSPVEMVEIEDVPTESSRGIVAASVEERPRPLTLEALLANCPKPLWNPDPKKILSFNSQNHVHGTEEFRTLRSRLFQIREKQPLRTVLVTSPVPGEGKSFIAANLAQVIVRQQGRRALLIDADLRWSRLHLFFGAPATPGLTDYLLGEADELSVIQRGSHQNLFFIAGGKSVSNPAELIGNGRLKVFLHRIAPLFDWIIIDSPAAIPISDASLLADLCDGVLLVVQANSTPFDVSQKVRQEFRDKRLLGVVLNRAGAGSGYSSYYFPYYGRKSTDSKRKS